MEAITEIWGHVAGTKTVVLVIEVVRVKIHSFIPQYLIHIVCQELTYIIKPLLNTSE